MAIRSSWATGEVLTSDDLTDTVADKVSRQGDTLSGQLDSAQLTPMHQFAADGSVLSNLPARVHPAEQLLKQAVWWIDAAHSSASGQSVSNLGWGGSALDAQVGSSGSADSNDPKYLDWQGENYIYLPGVSGNYLSVPDEAALDITDVDVRLRVSLSDYTPSSSNGMFGKRNGATNQYSYAAYVESGGTMVITVSASGTAGLDAGSSCRSTAALPTSDGDAVWLRYVFDADDGAGNRVYRYYYAADSATEPSSWTQLGTDRTIAGATTLFSGSAPFYVGAVDDSNAPATGKFHRAIVKDGIDGTPVLDIDCSQISSGADTSFTALTGQTVTINRSTSGRKAVAVTHPCWLFGTDDYMEVSDNALINFGASDDFTVLAVVRQWATPGNGKPWISKRNSSIDYAGYVLRTNGTSLQVSGGVDSGAPAVNDAGTSAFSAGSLAVVMLTVDRTGNLLKTVVAGSLSSGSDISSVGSLSNSVDMRVGAEAGSVLTYQDFEGIAFAIFRRALTSGEIATLNSYFQGREGA